MQMQVIVRDRQAGKTTGLVDWLLAPESGPLLNTQGAWEPPYWKRIIVVMHGERERNRVRHQVFWRFYEVVRQRDWAGWLKDDPNWKTSVVGVAERASDAVWNFDKLTDHLRGIRLASRRTTPVEYCVDDVNVLVERYLAREIGYMPALITLAGERECEEEPSSPAQPPPWLPTRFRRREP